MSNVEVFATQDGRTNGWTTTTDCTDHYVTHMDKKMLLYLEMLRALCMDRTFTHILKTESMERGHHGSCGQTQLLNTLILN